MLIIVESPAKAKTISKIVGSKHQVKASVGHIRSISNEKKTDDGRRLEINGIDIEKDFKPIFVLDDGKKKVVSELKTLAKAAKDGILFATDEDREGEAISWHLAEVLKLDPTKIQRLVFHEITKNAILKAMESPRPLDTKLVSAQQARQVLDKLVGYKLSPVLWSVMNNNHLSAGRVQSPALRLICEREKEILAFVPTEYWEIHGLFDGQKNTEKPDLKLITDDKEKSSLRKLFENQPQNWLALTKIGGKKVPKELSDKKEIQNLLERVGNLPEFKVVSLEEKTEYGRTKPPFITSTLQQAASSRLGFTPKQTMSVAQKLYEGIQIDGEPTALITYMRTDSTNLSAESIAATRKYISSKYPKFLPEKPKFYASKSRNAQEAHEAIRPVDPLLTPEKLKNKLEPNFWKLYDLIWRQTISCQMTDEVRNRLSFEVENSAKDVFNGSIAWTVSAGFKAVYDPSSITEKPDNIILQKDQDIYLRQVAALQNFTKPPSRYSPASLIKKMEELGIGRPSTYASIISTLTDRNYAEIKQNVIYPSTLGIKVSDLLTENFTEVTGSELTANMEDNLDQISRGEKEYKQVLSEFWINFKQQVESQSPKVSEFKSKYQTTQTDVLDPKFGEAMVLKVGRFGEYYQNPNHPESIYPKNFREVEAALAIATEQFKDQIVGKVCDECQKPLIVRVSKATLNTYIACPDYKVGNKHTVLSVNYGPCPKCANEGRNGVLVKKTSRGRTFLSCSLPRGDCGFTEPIKAVQN
jgi:DNA topoisomerase-1